MKGFDLYRIAMGYLGVIFLLCAVVVFKPFSAIRPAAEAVALVPPVAELVAMPAPPAPASDPQTWVAVTTGPTVPVPPGVVAQVAADAGPAAHGPTAQVAGVDDTAEQVARLVAEPLRRPNDKW